MQRVFDGITEIAEAEALALHQQHQLVACDVGRRQLDEVRR